MEPVPGESSDREDKKEEKEEDHEDPSHFVGECCAEQVLALPEEVEGELLHISLED